MSFCGSVVRSIRVSGSCGAWFPVVLASMRSNGLCDVSGDLSSLRLSGAYSGGCVTVVLVPSDTDDEVLISVTAASISSGGDLP